MYGAIAANDEDVNILYVVSFISVAYKIQEDVESYGNQLASGDLYFNEIYTHPGRHKSLFMSIHI